MNKSLIDVQGLTLIRGHRRLFKKMTFSLPAGEALHIRGNNGSGKTSLFKIIMGMLTPTFGSVKIFGKHINELDEQDYKNMLYLGHKNPIKGNLSIEENLILNSQLFDGLSVNAELLELALKKVGLWNFRKQPANRLSAGQKRRISIARLWVALSYDTTEKKLWILDEPLTALDAEFIDILQSHINSHLELGGGVIFTSHQPLVLKHGVQELYLEGFQ
ncbi:MAG: cytochrome c biogenesis heme-transporting ATPase CcmA [Gammaproteobacteria bacterium]|nr:cytochrome c biogenesis heme-transporting ATPase CcmA [Gammaproteobacteria bacterium]